MNDLNPKSERQARPRPSGQAMLIVLLLITTVGGLWTTATSTSTLKLLQQSQNAVTSIKTYEVGEAGMEDAVLGLVDPTLAHNASSYALAIDGTSTTVSTALNGNAATIDSSAATNGYSRALETTLTTNADGASFHYAVQVGDGGVSLSNVAKIVGSVYSDGSIGGGNGSAITGDATVATGLAADPSVYWSATDSSFNFGSAAANQNVAQSFIATATGSVTRVSTFISKFNGPTRNLTLRLNADNGGKPATASLATGTIAAVNIGATASWVNGNFSNPPTVTSGTKYWIILDDNSNSATKYFVWSKDSTGGYASNTGKYTTNCCSGSPTWTDVGGDLDFEVWIGGTSNSISGVTIGDATSGTGHANSFSNTTIHGSDCPNAYCIVDNQPHIDLPISPGVIQDWKNDIATASNGPCAPPTCNAAGNLTGSNNATLVTPGPLQVGTPSSPKNVSLANGVTLHLNGSLWVTGNFSTGNGCNIELDSSFGANSGIIVVDGTVSFANGCNITGSGNSSSSIMVLTDKSDHNSAVLSLGNGTDGGLFYASDGIIGLANGATANELSGWGISTGNGAVITYKTGLANPTISSGPTGGWTVNTWKEVN